MMFIFFLGLGACTVDSKHEGDSDAQDSAMDSGDGVDCSTQFVYSLVLTLRDEDGQPLSNAFITYSVDGVDGCFVGSNIDGEYYVGGEKAGEFVVDIYAETPDENGSDCFDIGEAQLELRVEADECHVITQHLEPELTWYPICQD